MTPPTLQCLPTELLLLIVAGVGEDLPLRRIALAGLSRTNKSLHATCNPVLYGNAIQQNAPEITTLAARDGNLETLMKAREYGADLNVVTWVPFPSWADTTDSHGNFVTNRGRWSNHDETSDDFGYAWATPLAMATCEGHYHVVKYLIALHVDVDVPGKLFCKCHVANGILEDGWPRGSRGPSWLKTVCHAGVWTPLHYALCRKRTSIARLLISYGASLTNTRYPVRSQIPRGNGIASLFGLDTVDTQEAATIRKRLGPLIRSLGQLETVQPEDTDTVNYNEDSGSDADGSSSEIRDGYCDYDAGEVGCAIHTAAMSGNETILRLLVLDHNIGINQQDRRGATVLHYALTAESIEILRCVLSFGANPNVPFDRFGNAAEWALFLNHSRKWTFEHIDQVMQALLDSGVSLWTQRRNTMAQPGEKSMVINQCADWLPGWCYYKDGWLRRCILGSIAEYDESRHRKLKREKMDFFWSFLLDPNIPSRFLDTLISLIGPINFMELVSEDTAPPSDHVVSAGATIGTQALRSLRHVLSSRCSHGPYEQSTEDRGSILQRMKWISKQGVPLSYKNLSFIAGIMRKDSRAW